MKYHHMGHHEHTGSEPPGKLERYSESRKPLEFGQEFTMHREDIDHECMLFGDAAICEMVVHPEPVKGEITWEMAMEALGNGPDLVSRDDPRAHPGAKLVQRILAERAEEQREAGATIREYGKPKSMYFPPVGLANARERFVGERMPQHEAQKMGVDLGSQPGYYALQITENLNAVDMQILLRNVPGGSVKVMSEDPKPVKLTGSDSCKQNQR